MKLTFDEERISFNLSQESLFQMDIDEGADESLGLNAPEDFALGFAPEEGSALDLIEGVIIVVGDDPYTGPVTVTPSQSPQTLYTYGKTMPGNVVVEAIPNYYGLITRNGSTITVS